MNKKVKLIIVCLCILVISACSTTSKKKESSFQTSCHKGEMSNRTKLSDAEMAAYGIQLPAEIHSATEQNLKDGKLIDAVKIIRGCLDVDLVSTKGIIDRMRLRLNLK